MTADERSTETSATTPLMPMRGTIVFPLGVIGVQVGIRSTLEMLAVHPEDPLRVILVLAPGESDQPIDPDELEEKIGVLARLSDRLNLPGGGVQATLQGIERVRLATVAQTDEHFAASAEPVEEASPPDDRAEELITRVITALDALAARVERIPDEATAILRMNTADPGRFADLVASLANFSPHSKDEVLHRLDIEDRLTYILSELEDQLGRARRVEETGAAEADEPDRALSPAERAEAIRRRIQALRTELGEIDPAEREAIELLRRVEAADLPRRVASQARAAIEHLRSSDHGSSQANVSRSYIDWLLHVPWTARATGGPSAIDLERVKEALDEELLDLDEPKDRLLDYLAVAKLRGDLYGPIPCIVGPPDVGKDSLVRAVARGLDRPLASLDLGGRGESQLVGIRRTRSGARPGKLIAAMRDVGVRDPVFHLGEMDRVGVGKLQGDPVGAMEEALEWDRRHAFVDRYLDLPFDISDALFIATAHDFYRVPRSLRELMVEVRIAGYTPEEKVEIARERMLPRIIDESGLEPDDVGLDEDALFQVARAYTRDSGMGMMRRSLATLLRTRARAKARGDTEAWEFSPDRIESILGLPRYTSTQAESAPEIGVVTGLAWTSSGGRLMFIEALTMPGSGRLIITGRLGDVMRESVNAAYSYVRSRGAQLDIPDSAFRDSDVHVHFPIGAMPKDGPSAGLAVTLAIASTLSDRPVRHDISMTGEVTLRGRVLEVGGVKEKVLAAYREQIHEVILPHDNERDLRDVPDDARDAIRFHFVERMDQVFELALLD